MAEMDTKSSQPETGNQSVQLGIGTLIIIALIVTMCSGRSEMEKIQTDTAELKQQLGVIDKKLDALAVMESQFLEGGANGNETLAPKAPEARKNRVAQVRQGHAARNLATAERFRKEMGEWYGAERAKKVKHAEAFEICEYGRRPSAEELKKLFPFFDGAGGESR